CAIVGVKFVTAVPKGISTFIVSLVITPFISCNRNELSSFFKTKLVIFFEEDKTGGGVEGSFLEHEINVIQFIKVRNRSLFLDIGSNYYAVVCVQKKVLLSFSSQHQQYEYKKNLLSNLS
ncbi:MAG TPA: hypothetical protein VFZ33_10325, partial [Chitinophagaceae bacterium]